MPNILYLLDSPLRCWEKAKKYSIERCVHTVSRACTCGQHTDGMWWWQFCSMISLGLYWGISGFADDFVDSSIGSASVYSKSSHRSSLYSKTKSLTGNTKHAKTKVLFWVEFSFPSLLSEPKVLACLLVQKRTIVWSQPAFFVVIRVWSQTRWMVQRAMNISQNLAFILLRLEREQHFLFTFVDLASWCRWWLLLWRFSVAAGSNAKHEERDQPNGACWFRCSILVTRETAARIEINILLKQNRGIDSRTYRLY